MSASITWSGMAELRAALRSLPTDLTGEAAHLVEGSANAAEATIKAAYPVRTGDLRDHLTQRPIDNGPFGIAIEVVNTSRLAGIFEYGTQARHTSLGASRGAMPPGNTFLPPYRRNRRAMWSNLADLVRRYGITVSGDAQ